MRFRIGLKSIIMLIKIQVGQVQFYIMKHHIG